MTYESILEFWKKQNLKKCLRIGIGVKLIFS